MQIFTSNDNIMKAVLSFGKKVGEFMLVLWRLLDLKPKYYLKIWHVRTTSNLYNNKGTQLTSTEE